MSYGRIIGSMKNRLVQGCNALAGIATGLIADGELTDAEVKFLNDWLTQNHDLSAAWPGDVLFSRVKAVLADGVITTEERAHLVDTLEKICGGSLDHISNVGAVNQLAFDSPPQIQHAGFAFCVTGDFVYGPRERVWETIQQRGGIVQKGITKKLSYLIVGLQGSGEWKHGSYGTKIEKAMEYKRTGLPISIVREDHWSSSLRST